MIYTDDGSEAYEYVYDESGNITCKRHHVDTYSQIINYSYSNTTWGDLLTSYNGTAITYDAIGTPLKWRNAQGLEWYGRRLALFANTNGEVYNYSYNADGLRTAKSVYNDGGTLAGITEYIYDGTKLIAENRSGDWLYYFYDANGAVTGMSYGGTLYYFRKNLQGDITGIYNAYGNIIARYEYTPYGALLAVTDANGNDISTNATHIANINPFRYRGYYYDTETGFYYLQSRYYDPVVGRFINCDAIIGANGGIIGYNLFAYSNNNPVMFLDPTGTCRQMWLEGKQGPCPGPGACSDYVTEEELYEECSDCPGFFLLYQIEYHGYKIRIDSAKNNGKKHIHIQKGANDYSQNFDGSPHHAQKGEPPNSIKKFIKERFGWDWDKKQKEYNNTKNNTNSKGNNTNSNTNTNVNKEVTETAVIVSVAVDVYGLVKLVGAVAATPYTGGWSMVLVFAP